MAVFFSQTRYVNKLNKSQIADLVVKIEGHSNNIAPAICGGLRICVKNEDGDHGTVVQLPLPKFKVVLCIPSFGLRTKHSRQILPKNLSLKDVVFNTSRIALLTVAFCRQDCSLLKRVMEDETHQPYRGKMIRAMNEVLEIALEAGGRGSYPSGSGHTLAAFCDKKDTVYVKSYDKEMEK